MNKRANLLWITGLILGWLLDLLFWKQGLGINFALYAVLCLLGGLLVLLRNGQFPAVGSLALLPLIVGFAAVTAIRAEPLTIFLGVCFVLFLMLVLSNSYLGGRWFWYGLGDYISSAFRLVGSLVARPASFQAQARKEQLEAGAPSKRANLWPVLRGIAIALPVVAVFASLLAAADAAFSAELQQLLKILAIENLPEYIFRMAYILIGAYLLVGVILHASTQSNDDKVEDGKRVVPQFLGFTEATIVLGSVALLFAAFVIVLFRYFFGGQANINVGGFTYSEYARRGFGELVSVAFFSLLMILGLEAITRREAAVQRRVFSGLSVAIVALVMVMLVSAYQRLALYEAAYGFSRLRTYTHVALVWIGLLLLAIVVLEMLQWQKAFMPAMLVAAIGFAASLPIVNVDALIVQQNVERARKGAELDVAYLTQLSTDAIPGIVKAFEDQSATPAVRQAAGAALVCRQHHYGSDGATGWQSFTFSRSQADLALKRVEHQLNDYEFGDTDRAPHVTTPAGKQYDCYGGGMMD